MTSPAPKPENEQARLQRLFDYNILDTSPEQGFDDIVAIAAEICDTPIALVSLVDDERQWFKAKHGLDANETGRDIAFCSHAILEPESVFEVPDAATDARFRENPLVTDQPHIAFYAGAPLVAEGGEALGTLCVIDKKPRKLTPGQLSSLQALARQVVAQMNLRRALQESLRLNNDLHDFAYVAAHDLRSPLRGISQLAGFIEEDCGECLPQNSRDDLGKLRGRVKRLDLMLQGLLQFSRLGYENAPRARIDPLARIKQLVDLIVPGQFVFETPQSMPNIFANENAFELVMRNILDNAVKYADGESAKIVVEAIADTAYLTIKVSDSGPGIPADQHDKVFKLFSTLQPRDKVEGSGMGLAIVKRAVEASGGSVSLQQDTSGGLSVCTKWALSTAENQ